MDPRNDIERCLSYLCSVYRRKTNSGYILKPQDCKIAKDLIAKCNIATVKTAINHMLKNDWGKANASMGVLSSLINKWQQDDPDEAYGDGINKNSFRITGQVPVATAPAARRRPADPAPAAQPQSGRRQPPVVEGVSIFAPPDDTPDLDDPAPAQEGPPRQVDDRDEWGDLR